LQTYKMTLKAEYGSASHLRIAWLVINAGWWFLVFEGWFYANK